MNKLCKFLGITVLAAVIMTGCATIGKENNGSFEEIKVPAKDFTSLGLVFTENVIQNNKGKVFTYYELLKKAQELGADAIVNVTIDVQREGTKILNIYLNPKETWYGSATAIKYTPGTLTQVTTNNTESTSVTKEGVIMNTAGGGSSGGGGGGSDGGGGGAKSFLQKINPLNWFK